MSQRPAPTPDSELALDWGSRARPDQPAPASAPELGLVQEDAAGKGMPGDPKHMSQEPRLSLAGLLEGSGLRIQQMRSWGEILVGV